MSLDKDKTIAELDEIQKIMKPIMQFSGITDLGKWQVYSSTKPEIAVFENKNFKELNDTLKNLQGILPDNALPKELLEFIKSLPFDKTLKTAQKILQQKVESVKAQAYLYKKLQQIDEQEIFQAVVPGDEKEIKRYSTIRVLRLAIEIIIVFCSISGYSIKDLFELSKVSEKELICQEYQIHNVENAEVREVNITKGTLFVRQYPKEKGKVLAELPNGERICLPNKPKGNQRWLKISLKDENGKVITGYVKAALTKRIY